MVTNLFKSKRGKALAFVSGGITAVICAVMNLFLLPQIESTTEGIRCFDMNFGYSAEDAKNFLMLLSDEGRALYLHVQLPLDFIYPLAYTVFFLCLLTRLSGRLFPLGVMPLALMAFDYTENICSIRMLTANAFSPSLASFASAVTSVKTLLMYAVFVSLIILIVVRLVKKRREKKA